MYSGYAKKRYALLKKNSIRFSQLKNAPPFRDLFRDKMNNARISWIGKRIAETFEPDISESVAETFLQQDNIQRCFEDLLIGKDTYRIFVHYQSGGNQVCINASSRESFSNIFAGGGER